MADRPFNEPKLALNRIYTRRGDLGETSLAGGQRVGKDALRINCYGTVDELNSFLGQAAVTVRESLSRAPELEPLVEILLRVQHELFNLGSLLATKPQDLHPRQPRITPKEIDQLELEIDQMNAALPVLRSFILPGGCRLNADLHICRTVCRRAERLAVALSREEEVAPEAIQYLNRLSDALFVWSRWASKATGAEEVLWQPNIAASANK